MNCVYCVLNQTIYFSFPFMMTSTFLLILFLSILLEISILLNRRVHLLPDVVDPLVIVLFAILVLQFLIIPIVPSLLVSLFSQHRGVIPQIIQLSLPFVLIHLKLRSILLPMDAVVHLQGAVLFFL